MKPYYHSLPDSVLPTHYELVFEPNLNKLKFTGQALIDVVIEKPTNKIRLNSKELKILNASILAVDSILELKVKEDKKNEELILTLPEKVKGKATLVLEFEGVHNEKMYGFYAANYTVKGKKKKMLSTHMEPSEARTVFPCFDQPDKKATYNVTLIIPKNLTAISNTPIAKETIEGSKKIVSFETTPIMSSYLLYLGVGEYDYVEGWHDNKRVQLRVYATPGKKKQCKLALEYARKLLKWQEDYFGIQFPLRKLDFIAVTEFSAGAMENWGSITFREVDLLGTEKSSRAVKERICEVISHELIHQWFGNLVTMKWWDDLWLNESFAEYMAFKAMHAVHPEWNTYQRFYENVQSAAFNADSLNTTHPISMKVKRVQDIDQVFDSISYNKGGSVLKMLEDWVGHQAFRKGLNSYLKKHAYSNAERDDLWNAIQKHAKNKPVNQVMQAWIERKGHPVINVSKTKNGFDLRQKRYTLLKSYSGTPWPVPLTYYNESEHKTLMTGKELKVKTPRPWIKVNYGQNGFYRVFYDKQLNDLIGKTIASQELSEIDAWGFEKDYFAQARSGRVKALDYLEFAEKYCLNSRYPLNAEVLGSLNFIYEFAPSKYLKDKSKELSVKLAKNCLKGLGWTPRKKDSNEDVFLRSQCIGALGKFEDAEAISNAWKLFKEHKKKGNLPEDLRGAVYSVISRTGTGKEYDYFFNLYKEHENPAEKIRGLAMLGRFKDKALAKKTLELYDDKRVRIQDSFYPPLTITGNEECKTLFWPWMKKNWKKLKKRYPESAHMLRGFVSSLTYVRDLKTYNEIEEFFKKKENKREDIELPIQNALERIQANIRFVRKNQ